jgi:hypothetical protein
MSGDSFVSTFQWCTKIEGELWHSSVLYIPFLSFSKMYSCYDSYVVYGVMEGDRNMVLEREWLETNFPQLSVYASDVVRNTMGNPVYGITGHLDSETGQVHVSDDEKKCIQELYSLLMKYCEETGHEKPSVGYFTVVSGDYEEEHEAYVPDKLAEED